MKLLILLLFCTSLSAAPMDLSWTWSVQRTDDSPFPISERGGVMVQYWISGQNSVQVDVNDPLATSITLDVPPATYRVQVFLYDSDGNQSDWTPFIQKIVGTPPPGQKAPPKPATNLR